MNKAFQRKHSDNSILKGKTQHHTQQRSPLSTKENDSKFKYPEVLRRKESKPLQVQTNQSDMRSPSAQSTQSPINKSILITHRSQSMFQDAQYIDYIITNKEVNLFLKKHFLHEHMHTNSSRNTNTKLICDSWDKVPVTYFIKALFDEYPEIIEDHHLNEKLNIKLKTLIKDLISEDGQLLSLNKLQIHTRHLGLLGLLLTALRDIQDAPTVNHNTPHNQSISHEQDISNTQQQQQSKFHKMASEITQSAENRINELVNLKLQQFTIKQKELEKQIQQLKQKATENFDLFQHEAKNKQVITNLTQQLQQKDQIIADLEQKLIKKWMNSSIEEETHANKIAQPKASPIKIQSPSQSPFNDSNQYLQRMISNLCTVWDLGCVNEDYRFAQILTAQENNQMPYQHFQLIPIIKTIPGFNDFIFKSQNNNHIITNFIQNCMNNDNNIILDLYYEIITLLPNFKISDQDQYLINVMQLFLKLTVSILQIKNVFNINKLKEWGSIKRQLTEQQNQFVKNLINQIVQINQYSIKQIPQSKLWNQQQIYHDQYVSEYNNRLIENQVINNILKKQLNQIHNKQNTKLSLIIRIIQCFYYNDVEELIGLMQSIQGETDVDIYLSKLILDCDCINLILFPSLFNPKYVLKSITNLLQFKCPGQFYLLYTKQVCQIRNIDLLIELLTKMHNTMNSDVVIKLWDVLGAIAKSAALKECKEGLQFIIRLYSNSHQATILHNIQQVQKNLAIPI
ncbi:unnamed protein product [Paramecium pentaurelia]|uniref:Uncharacterized protein n=1 Tax=Paramecium pentaurelia TaxID=43138 RepID=A0A8S1VUY7_9CILI|nr:unnamed protein product [Paramecium pentaurelia]